MSAAHLAAAGTLVVAVTIAALHVIKPELAPSWRFISEYSIGHHGWIMRLAFMMWGASCGALAWALRPEVRTRLGSTGVAVLFLVAAALVMAGAFNQDPVTATPDEATTNGALHAIAALIGIPGIPIAAMLISSSLWKANPTWTPHGAVIMSTAHATWISLVLMVAYLAWAVPQAGGFNPQVWAGWMNRVVVTTYLLWQLAIAARLIARSRNRRT